ncbi:MAG: response regulator [Candidatus Dormibacteria bacterium]
MSLRGVFRRVLFPVILLLCALAPLAVLAEVSVGLASNAVSDQVQGRLTSTASVTALEVASSVGGLADLVTAYSLRSDLISAAATGPGLDPALATPSLLQLQGARAGIQYAFTTDSSCVLRAIYPATPALMGRDFSFRDWCHGATATGSTYVSETYPSAVPGQGMVIAAAAPVRAGGLPTGAVLGYLVAAVSLSDTESLVEHLERTESVRLTVTDQHGNLLAAPGFTGSSPVSRAKDPRVSAALLGQSGLTGTGGGLSAYAPIPRLGWVVISEPPPGVFAPVDLIRNTVVTVSLILGASICALVLLLLISGQEVSRQRDRQHARDQLRLGRLQAMGRNAQLIHELRDERRLSAIAQGAREVTDSDHAALITLAPGSLTEVETFTAAGADVDGVRHPTHLVGLLERPVTTRATVRVAEARDHPDAVGTPAGHPFMGPYLAVPLLTGDSVIGVLAVSRAPGSAVFTEQDQAGLEATAGHAVTALRNLRLNQELEQMVNQLTVSNAELEEASRLKSQFLANMSHELRTPLSAILGFADILHDGIDGQLNEEQLADVAQIRTSGQTLLDLINDVLDLSRIEAGRMVLNLHTIEVSTMVADVVATVQHAADQRGLALRMEAPRGAVLVHADPLRARQVLTNLVSNAIKFTDSGEVVIAWRETPPHATITVRDTGPGIAADALGYIFDEFRQADASIIRQHSGTGLGLAISRRLVESQGGTIWVQSTPGAGSEFSFTLPMAGAGQAPAPAPDGAAPGAIEGPVADRILVVDDDPAVRALIRRRLEAGGYVIEEAGNAEAAVETARSINPAAVILDINLSPEGGADGWDVLRSLKADRSTAQIPVVVASVLDGREVALEMGAAGYLQKPFEAAQLLQSVELVVGTLATASVLCVDDEPTLRDLVARMLAGTGCEVATAGSAEQALAAVEARVPDLMIIDLMMPGMSGFELIARLRARAATRYVPIVVISAKDLTPEDRLVLEGDIQRFISKADLHEADLVATVRQTLVVARAARAGKLRA